MKCGHVAIEETCVVCGTIRVANRPESISAMEVPFLNGADVYLYQLRLMQAAFNVV